MNISQRIDYTLLHPTSSEKDIINLCSDAIINNYYSICINSSYTGFAKLLLKDSNVKISTVIGFPFGAMSTKSKIQEAKTAVEDGADEIEMVINLGYLKSRNYLAVLKDIYDVKNAIGNIPLKVIIEISELNKNEIIKACEICLDAKADYIKTSSGFSKSGATLASIRIIRKTVKGNMKICAFGDINDMDTANKYIDLGVSRIGTSVNLKSSALLNLSA